MESNPKQSGYLLLATTTIPKINVDALISKSGEKWVAAAICLR
jgi:hypothetical protein